MIALALAAGLLGCERGPGRVPGAAPETPSPATFVGSARCAACHQAEAAAFRESDHARAMAPAHARTVLGDFADVRIEDGGATTVLSRRGGRFLVRTQGPDGRPGEFEIAYTLGVDPLQQYLVPLPGGRLQVLGLAWDTRPHGQGGQRWFAPDPGPPATPGDARHWTAANQTWNAQCADCHVTGLRPRYDAAADRYRTAWAELGVGCEACHGPGSRHAAWAAGGGRGPAGAAPGLPVTLGRTPGAWAIRDPVRGIAERTLPAPPSVEVDVCGRCHARRQRIAAPEASGGPLLDTHVPALLEPGLYHVDGQVQGEVYEYGSFVQSRMFRAGVTCSDCHEPHAGTLRAPGNALCAACHAPGRFDTPAHHGHPVRSAGARCVSCHMPARGFMVVDRRRDHAFAVPRPDLAVALGTPEPCTGCHEDRTPGWAADRVRAWRGGAAPPPHFARALDAGRRGRADAGPLLAAVARDPSQPGIVRATAVALLAEFLTPSSAGVAEAALGDGDPLVRMAALSVGEARPGAWDAARAAPLLRDPIRAVRVVAARVLAARREALGAAGRADLDRAVAEAVAAERINADRPEARVNLAALYARLGRAAEAETELRAALRLAPRFVPAWIRLADLLPALGRAAERDAVLEAALRAAPGSADALHALGLLRAGQGRWAEALDLLRRAAEARPDATQLAHVYAVALHTAGRAPAAIQVLETAHRRRPADREILAALAAYLAERGDLAPALAYGERWLALDPEDPEARVLVRSLRDRSRPR